MLIKNTVIKDVFYLNFSQPNLILVKNIIIFLFFDKHVIPAIQTILIT